MSTALPELGLIPQTLLIPLVARAEAPRHCPDLGFRDPWAERLVATLEGDLEWVRHDAYALRSCALRAQWIDRVASDFLKRHPQGLVLSLGAGLDARRARLTPVPAAAQWWELDLPEVAELRARILPAAACGQSIAADAFDAEWLAQLPAQAGQALLVIAEGLFMYIERERIEALCARLQQRQQALAAPLELCFDALHPWIVRRGMRMSSLRFRKDLRDRASPFRSAVSGLAAAQRLLPGSRVQASLDLLEHCGGLVQFWSRLRARLVRDRPLYGLYHLLAR